jgi:hypothetical protein
MIRAQMIYLGVAQALDKKQETVRRRALSRTRTRTRTRPLHTHMPIHHTHTHIPSPLTPCLSPAPLSRPLLFDQDDVASKTSALQPAAGAPGSDANPL